MPSRLTLAKKSHGKETDAPRINVRKQSVMTSAYYACSSRILLYWVYIQSPYFHHSLCQSPPHHNSTFMLYILRELLLYRLAGCEDHLAMTMVGRLLHYFPRLLLACVSGRLLLEGTSPNGRLQDFTTRFGRRNGAQCFVFSLRR